MTIVPTNMTHEHVKIAVIDAPQPGAESVPARALGNNKWQLIRSPLYAISVASGDVVKILNEETGAFVIVSRGGNVCVQFYLDSSSSDDYELTSEIAKKIEQEVNELDGSMDGFTAGLIAFTLPVDVGFPAIEEVFSRAIERYQGAECQFSNVYDTNTGEPLNWWI